MKKVLTILLFVISIGLISCNTDKDFTIAITNNVVQLDIGESIVVSYTASDNSKKIIFESDNEEICAVGENNSLIGIASGSCNILVYFEGMREGAQVVYVTVSAASTVSLNITGEKVVDVGKTIQLSAAIEGTTVDLTWTTSDATIATINESGVLTGIKAGKVTITVTDKNSNIESKYDVEVVKRLTSLQITGANTGKVGSTIQLSTNETDVEVDLTWTTSDATIATVSDAGLVTLLKGGKVTISVVDEISSLTATFAIEVQETQTSIASEILEWAISQVGTEGVGEVTLPTKHPNYASQITWESEDNILFDTEFGFLDLVDVDTKVNITCIVTYEGETVRRTYEFTVLSYALHEMSNKFISQFKTGKIFVSMSLITTYNNYGGTTITWSSSDNGIFNGEGKLNKPFSDTPLVITYTVKTTSPSLEKTFTYDVVVEGMSIDEKGEVIQNYLLNDFVPNGTLTSNIVLPNYLDEFDCKLAWYNTNGSALDLNFSIGNPVLDDGGMYVVVEVEIEGKTTKLSIYYKTNSDVEFTKWELIKLYTDTIASTTMQTYNYSLISWMGTNYGYIPFVTLTDSDIAVDILPYTYGKQRSNILKTSTEYIVVHDTGNPRQGADGAAHARAIANYNNNPEQDYISWHFTVDDTKVYQHLPLDEVAYHAGDGSRVFGDTYYNTTYGKDCIGGGNRNGIGIETCIDLGSDYTQTMRHTAKLVAELLIQYNLGHDRIKQHYNFSGKNCPQVMRENNRWSEFLYLVKLEYFAKTQLQGVKLEWTSSTACLDNQGRITSQQKVGTVVNYSVKATYDGQTNTYNYTSTLQSR